MVGTISLSSGALRWWVVPLAYVCSMVVLVAVSIIGLPPQIGQAAVFLGYVLLATGFALSFAKADAAHDLGISKPFMGQRALLIGAAAAVITILISEVAALLDQDVAVSTKTVLKSIGFGTDHFRDLIIIGTICCLAPFGEEALYRGLIFRGLYNTCRTPLGPWVATVIAAALAAILFAFSHGGEGQEASVIAVLFLSGLVFGLCYAISGSLWSAILAHSINNSFALALVALPSPDVALANKLFVIIAPAITGALVWGWARLLQR